MDFKDFLPVVGIILGWLLSETSSYLKGRDSSFKSTGQAISNFYMLYMEMVQVKMAYEKYKNMTSDIKVWEHGRQRAFKEYTSKDPNFSSRLSTSIDYIAEFAPLEAFQLREIISKYEFMKSRDLNVFLKSEKLYLSMLSGYETGFLGYQFLLEKSIRKLAQRHSVFEWLKIEIRIRAIKKYTDPKDMVFGSQVLKKKK
ncbi:hypothetical protein [Gilvimarinus japonicus]|uniref:Uncharacterized protein n=1 Tax=Gilvimarinus japonicus TaxID=1796469 RepID=A0ABV7HKX4_9GAMM